MVFFAEAYLSALLRYGVLDASGKRIGTLEDLLVRLDEKFPEVVCLVLRRPGTKEPQYLSWTAVRTASREGVRLSGPLDAFTPLERPAETISLRHDVLDRQIVDVSGQRVVRVHDLKLGAVGNRVLLTHADIGSRGLLRRMGWEHFVLGFLRTFGAQLPEKLIAWEHVRVPSRGTGAALEVDRGRDALQRMHPADLADIAEELSAPERAAFLGAMDEETAADAMQEMEPEAQVAVVNELPDQQAADLIDEMDPDAGADLLADLPQERANTLLNLMEPEEAGDLRRLLAYAEDTAGGLMTPELVTVPEGVTAARALELVREGAQEVEDLYYLHIVDEDNRLVGMLSLRELIMAAPTALLEDLMHRETVTVTPDTPQHDLAHIVSRYNLLAIPVVDEERHLLGIVTSDDAIDSAIPTSYKKRLPRVFARR
ncbi:MAG TPA: CBS domain-containing protein [Armatimonadota bacterium]|jgi:CBS domain-containing protein